MVAFRITDRTFAYILFLGRAFSEYEALNATVTVYLHLFLGPLKTKTQLADSNEL
jgi:hypothetical protein